MIAEWAQNHELDLHTGVLLWDLSSAFDTIDVDVRDPVDPPYITRCTCTVSNDNKAVYTVLPKRLQLI